MSVEQYDPNDMIEEQPPSAEEMKRWEEDV